MKVCALMGVVVVGGCRTAYETRVTSVPVVAHKAFEMYAEGGRIHGVEMKKRCGMVFYQAEVWKLDGTKIEITVSEEGQLYQFERRDMRHE